MSPKTTCFKLTEISRKEFDKIAIDSNYMIWQEYFILFEQTETKFIHNNYCFIT
jgi:hypothetical protein